MIECWKFFVGRLHGTNGDPDLGQFLMRPGSLKFAVIGAPCKADVHAVLSLWPGVAGVPAGTTALPDYELPAGAMALVALALDQWGPPP